MLLNDLKPAWKQFKLTQNMQELNPTEILSIIEAPEARATQPYRLLMKAVVFLVITFFCVGG